MPQHEMRAYCEQTSLATGSRQEVSQTWLAALLGARNLLPGLTRSGLGSVYTGKDVSVTRTERCRLGGHRHVQQFG